MLRAVLLACPVVLVFAVSCSGSDSASFTKGGPGASGSAGTPSSASGSSAGGTAAQGGSNAAAGSDATAGKASTAGSANTAGSGNMAGSQSTGGKGGTGSNGGSGNTAGNQTGGKGGGGGNAGTANAGGVGGTTGPGGAAGAAGDNTGPLCPNLVGNYTITNVDGGLNCNGLNKNAPQSIVATEIPCRMHFVSEGASPNANVGVNGGAPLEPNGDFTGATLMFNKTSRDPCSGVWDAGNGRLTIKCGGQGDQCTAELERN